MSRHTGKHAYKPKAHRPRSVKPGSAAGKRLWPKEPAEQIARCLSCRIPAERCKGERYCASEAEGAEQKTKEKGTAPRRGSAGERSEQKDAPIR